MVVSGIGRPAASPKGKLVTGFVHSYTFVGSKPTDHTKTVVLTKQFDTETK